MKKLISIILAFAMLFSMAMPAMAADITGSTAGDVSGTYDPTVAITGVSLIVDGVEHKEGLVTLTAANSVELKVYGTNLQYGSDTQMILYEPHSTVSLGMGYDWVVSPDGTWATVSRDITYFSNITVQHTIQYSNNGDTDWLDSNVSVIYDNSEEAAITGVSVTVDGVPYTSGNVTIYSDSEVTVTVTGINLDNASTNHAVKITPDIRAFIQDWTKTETTATKTFVTADLSGADSFQLQYCNDWITAETWQDTGIYLTYNEGTKPVPTSVTFNAMLKAVDRQGNEVARVAGYWDGSYMVGPEQQQYSLVTGLHTVTDWVNTTGYKTPADIILTVTDDGNGNGILTTESTHASITTETVDGETVYVITVTLEEENTEPTYTITTASEGEGAVSADKTSATEGETVTVTFTPGAGYALFDWYACEPNNDLNTVELTQVDVNTYTFTMPAHPVRINGWFVKNGKAREDLYFNNNGSPDWTDVTAFFYTDTGSFIYSVTLTMAENGVYTIPEDEEIPNLAYKVYFVCNSGNTEMAEIPTGEANMFTLGTTTNEDGEYKGTWSKYTPSQPPEEVTSAEITWGSMAFTYTDDAGEWSVDGTAEDAGTVTVKNTGTTEITASAEYASTEEYKEITGTLGEGKTLKANESGTFTLKLSGKPEKAITAGTKIGTVTVTIE